MENQPKKIKPIREPWKGTMTPRERFNRQMNYKSIDRCFNMEFGYWAENYEQWDIFRDNGIKNDREANIFFGFDHIDGIYGNTWISPGFEQKVIEERDDKLIIQNSDGLTAEVSKDGHSSIPHFINSSVKTPDDWKRVKEQHFRVDDPARIINVEEYQKFFPNDRDFPVGISCGSMIGRIRDMLTFEGICYAWADYPDMLEDMVETCCRLAEKQLDQVLGKIEFDYASGWEDICFNYGPILPISFFKEIIAPRYKRIGERLKKHGIDIWYTDCDGDVRQLIPIFMECGINCLFPYEVNSCTHPGNLLDEYDGLRIMGGVDKMALGAGKSEIRSYLKSLEKYVARGGYIPFCDHLCPPNVTPENYLYYLDLKEEMFGM
jgi:Uroporphyrinogen decarboxylase (URO-D).